MSWRPVLQRGSEPLYICLSNLLEQDISSGILLPGTKLPPQRELADYLDVNLSTIARAFKICSKKGLLSGNVGRGTYVAYDVSTKILPTPPVEEKSVIELGIVMPETIQQDEIFTLLQEMMMEADYGRFFQYSIHVDKWQRQAAAKLLIQIGCEVTDSQICFANGAQNALAAIFAGIFQPGDYVGVDPLVYPGVKSVAGLFGVQLVPIRQKDQEMSEEGLRYAVKNYGIRAIYVMPDCHNPTTHTMSDSCRMMIGRVAKEFDLLVIEDSMDRLLQVTSTDTIFSIAPERTIFILSLSKSVNPALRLAYMAVPENYIGIMEDALYNLNLSQSALLLEIASRLIVSDRLKGVLKDRRCGLVTRNNLTDCILKDYEIMGNEYSLGRWLLLPKGITGIQFEKAALERGVFVYGGERFAVGKDAPAGAVRVAICAPESVEKLKSGLLILKQLLTEFQF